MRKVFFRNILFFLIIVLIIKVLGSCSDPCSSQPKENLNLRVGFKNASTGADISLTFTSIKGTGSDSVIFQSTSATDTINSVFLPLSPFSDTVEYVFISNGKRNTITIAYNRQNSTACGFKTTISGISLKNSTFVRSEVIKSTLDNNATQNNILLYF